MARRWRWARCLAGFASGEAGIAVHHAVCQTIVRMAGTPHAETNAVMLPHTARFAAGRAPAALERFARAMGGEDAAERIAPLSALCGVTRLSELGVAAEQLSEVAEAAAAHPALAATPGGAPSPEELRDCSKRPSDRLLKDLAGQRLPNASGISRGACHSSSTPAEP